MTELTSIPLSLGRKNALAARALVESFSARASAAAESMLGRAIDAALQFQEVGVAIEIIQNCVRLNRY